jgi:AcrR family transcriptional regulator
MSEVEPLISVHMGKAEMLIEAARDLWCTGGSGELSARALAAAARLSPSMIYYHFGDIERLYLTAQDKSIAAAREWCAAQAAMLGMLGEGLPSEAFGPVLAQLIDSFCTDERRLALAWRECQILAARAPLFHAARDAWTGLWRRFWQETCARFGLGEVADLIHYFFEGEGFLHLMQWNRVADRASLDETANAWVGWLTGRPCRGAPWRCRLMAQARRANGAAEELGDTRQRIAMAAAKLLLGSGTGAINHRAVAAEAGLTLGVVSHNCKRADDLLRLAHAEVYRGLAAGFPRLPAIDGQAAWDLAPHLQVLALDELIIAVARERAAPNFALQLRYLRGATTRQLLTGPGGIAEAGEGVLDLGAAIYSGVMMGASRALADRPPDEIEPALIAVHDRVLRLVRSNGGH